MIWALLAALAVLAIGFTLAALRGRTTMPVEASELAVYRAQLAEIAADLERGVLAPEAAAAARLEVERRLLKAAAGGERAAPRPLTVRLYLLAAAVAMLGAGVLYMALGNPLLPAAPAKPTTGETVQLGATTTDMAGLVDKLFAFLAARPDDLEGWGHLRRAAPTVGRLADYAQALAAAVRARPDNGTLRALYAESLLMMDNGKPSAATRFALAEALRVDPVNPAARYYQGVILAEDGKTEAARQVWQSLLAEGGPDAPWRAQVLARLQALDMTGLSPEERQASIRAMVEGLAARLQPVAADREGWARLARAWAVLGEMEKSRHAHAMAVKLATEANDQALLDMLKGEVR